MSANAAERETPDFAFHFTSSRRTTVIFRIPRREIQNRISGVQLVGEITQKVPNVELWLAWLVNINHRVRIEIEDLLVEVFEVGIEFLTRVTRREGGDK